MEKIIDNRFELETAQPMNESSMFNVYKARELQKNNTVVIKFLKEEYSRDAAVVDSLRSYFIHFQQHVKNTKNLANIINFSGTAGREVYIVQEYVEGRTLDNMLQQADQFQVPGAIDILEQICEGLHSLHIRNLCHYNLIPRNIIIDEAGQAKLVGFGALFPILGKKEMISRVTAGVDAFFAQEILDGHAKEDISASCDIYALGKIIETLRVPFNKDILLRAIAKEPHKRYKEIRDFKADLKSLFLGDASGEGTNDGPDKEEDGSVEVDKTNEDQKEDDIKGPAITTIELEKLFTKVNQLVIYQLPVEIKGNLVQKAECKNCPPGSFFKEKEKIFRWTPDSDHIGLHTIEFYIWFRNEKTRALLPIEVKPGVIVVKKDKKIDIPPPPSPLPPVVKVPEWKVNTTFICNKGDTAKFNINNPDPARFAAKMYHIPPELKNAGFDERTGEFRWKTGKKDVGSFKIMFELTDLDNPEVSTRKAITVQINDPAGKPAPSKDKKAPQPASAAEASVLQELTGLFLWPYNLILFIGGAFAAVYISRGDIIIDLGIVVFLEALYLFIALNSNTIKKHILKKK